MPRHSHVRGITTKLAPSRGDPQLGPEPPGELTCRTTTLQVKTVSMGTGTFVPGSGPQSLGTLEVCQLLPPPTQVTSRFPTHRAKQLPPLIPMGPSVRYQM